MPAIHLRTHPLRSTFSKLAERNRDNEELAITSSGLYSLSVGKIRTIVIPIPPLTEQHRIVAKVEELMAFCDRLEAKLTTSQTESRRFLEAVLHEALSLRSEPEQTLVV